MSHLHTVSNSPIRRIAVVYDIFHACTAGGSRLARKDGARDRELAFPKSIRKGLLGPAHRLLFEDFENCAHGNNSDAVRSSRTSLEQVHVLFVVWYVAELHSFISRNVRSKCVVSKRTLHRYETQLRGVYTPMILPAWQKLDTIRQHDFAVTIVFRVEPYMCLRAKKKSLARECSKENCAFRSGDAGTYRIKDVAAFEISRIRWRRVCQHKHVRHRIQSQRMIVLRGTHLFASPSYKLKYVLCTHVLLFIYQLPSCPTRVVLRQ